MTRTAQVEVRFGYLLGQLAVHLAVHPHNTSERRLRVRGQGANEHVRKVALAGGTGNAARSRVLDDGYSRPGVIAAYSDPVPGIGERQ